MNTVAIAAPSFDQPSETFIRDHVRNIAPGETVLLSARPGSEECLGCPVLDDVRTWRPATWPGARVVNSLTFRWRDRVNLALGRRDEGRVVAFLREHGVRAMLVEFLNHAYPLVPAARKAGVPLYAHAHGFDVSFLSRSPRWRRRYTRLFREAEGIIAPSRFLAGKLAAIGCPEAKLHVSPCGVDPDCFLPTRRLPLRLLAVGRFVVKKAPQNTIRAFAKVRDAYPDARLDFVGDGWLLSKCRALGASLGVAEAIHFHGAQPPEFVQHLMREASVFVQHSVTAPKGDTESLGVSLLEAMASEVPIVATRHNGFVETVVDGETGLLVEEHDIDGMAEAICALLADPDRARAMGEAGRRRVQANFTHAHTRDRLRAIMRLPPADRGAIAAAQAASPGTSKASLEPPKPWFASP